MYSPVRTFLKLQHACESSIDLVKAQVLIQWVGRGLRVCISHRLQGDIEGAFLGTTHGEARGQRDLINMVFPPELAGLQSSCLTNSAVEAQRGQ